MANKHISQYQIKSAVVYADRFDYEFDMQIGNMIHELNIVEDITMPYLTGQMLVVDKGGLFSNYRFSGSEFVDLELVGIFGDKVDQPINKTFLIRGKHTVAGDNTTFLFDLIEEHGFLGTTKVISKSYTGKKSKIVETILKGQLDKEIDTTFLKPDLSGKNRIILPNVRVLDGVRDIVSGMVSQNGAPFFLYPSLYSEYLRLGSFEYMLSVDPFNKNAPYTYAPAHTHSTHDNPHDLAQTVIIEDYEINGNTNEHFLAQVGANGSRCDVTNIGSTDNKSYHVFANQKLNDLIKDIPNIERNVIDGNFMVNNEYVTDLDSRKVHSLTSKLYLDIDDTEGDTSESYMKNKSFANSLKHILSSNAIDVQAPGASIMANRVTVGDNIRMRFRKIDETETKYDDIYDNELSDYFITNMKHVFKEGKHTVAMTVTKFTRDFKEKDVG